MVEFLGSVFFGIQGLFYNVSMIKSTVIVNEIREIQSKPCVEAGQVDLRVSMRARVISCRPQLCTSSTSHFSNLLAQVAT